jgi:hypothetical protein
VQVLIAGEVAAYDDQVQALAVLEREVADRRATGLDDPEGVGVGSVGWQRGPIGDQGGDCAPLGAGAS